MCKMTAIDRNIAPILHWDRSAAFEKEKKHTGCAWLRRVVIALATQRNMMRQKSVALRSGCGIGTELDHEMIVKGREKSRHRVAPCSTSEETALSRRVPC